MPPRRSSPDGTNRHISAFERAHPNLQKFLFTGFQIASPLLFTTTLFAAGALKRPLWERVFFWRASLFSFLCRWIWLSCMVTWTLNGWGGDESDLDEDQDQEGQQQGGTVELGD